MAASRGYVTFLAGSGDYVMGVVGLAKGLRRVRSAYPLVVAVLPDVPDKHRHILRAQGCVVREIDPIHPPDNQVNFAMPYYVINYSKLRIWNFEDYSKMVYLDADIQVYENIDHLFDTPNGYIYAVMDCFCEKTWSHSRQYEIGYCQQCPDKVKWAAPPPLYFNAGMFVFEPNRLTYQSLLETLQITEATPFAEQGSKPWRYTGKEANMDREDIKMLVGKWWDIYNDHSLDFKPDDGESFCPLSSSIMSETRIMYIPTSSVA